MEQVKIEKKDYYRYVDVSLYIKDIKMLYEACVVIQEDNPNMGYDTIAKKLMLVMEDFVETNKK